MPEVRFQDRTTMAGKLRKTSDGYLVGEVHCARTGIQEYYAGELGLEDEFGDRVINVYRPEETVFDRSSMATFAGKPVTLMHPPEAVTADTWRKYAVGDIGEDIARDGDMIRVPITLMDAEVIKAVEDGTREISMGYTCGLEIKPGRAVDGTVYDAVQVGPLKINHLAIVPKARGGSDLSIKMDSAPTWGARPSSIKPLRKDKAMPDNLQKIVIDGITIETTEQGAQALKKLQDENKKLREDAAAAETAHATDMAKVEAERDSLKAKLADAEKKSDQSAIDAAVQARADLIAKAKAIAPDLKTDGLSDADIRKGAVVAKLGDKAIEGKAQAYIDARFDILAEDAGEQETFAKAIGGTISTPRMSDSEAAYEAALAAQRGKLNSRFAAKA